MPRHLTASTRVAGVIGDPIEHSLSPVIHNAAFEALGLDWAYVALKVAAGSGATAVAGMRALGLAGLSVTMPLKAEVIASLDRVERDAALLGAVNCISAEGATLVGDNTDGAGFLAGLRTDFDLDPAGRRCVVLGAGGAARAVVLALARAGAASVQVVNRTPATAESAAALAGDVGSVASPEAVAEAELVVNATPVGMGRPGGGPGSIPCDPTLLGTGQFVVDLVYHPARTPLISAAEERGARAANGMSMLVHQAAVAFERWTGAVPPVDVMRDAVTAELQRSTEDASAKS